MNISDITHIILKVRPMRTYEVPLERMRCGVCGKNVLLKLFKVTDEDTLERSPTPCEAQHGIS